jgi:hypothetical protein
METIRVGDRVRSYDFPGVTDCFVEGIVVGIGEEIEGCPRYRIRITGCVFQGRDVTDCSCPQEFVFPPVNGTPRLFGGVCSGVQRL